MTAKYTADDLRALADDTGPFAQGKLRAAIVWAADVLDAADSAVRAERNRANEARHAALEEAAKACEELDGFSYDDPGSSAAAAIRQLAAAMLPSTPPARKDK